MWECDPALTAKIVDSYQMAGPIFVKALTSFFAAQCAIYGDHLWPEDAAQKVLEDPNYDFVVVGAGSAGSVVANRLSEISNWKVLLVEAGGNPTLGTETPQLFYSNMGTAEDWGYKTEPQEGFCRAYKTKQCAWPRGKVLGGSSSINAMFYVRANKADYDEWANMGNKNWSYEDVLPYFKKSENFLGELNIDNVNYHSKGGYLNVNSEPEIHEFEKLLIKAGMELGFTNNSDYNSASQMGIMKAYMTTEYGKRFSTARAFLSPIKDRANLHVIKNTLATKIIFKTGTKIVQGIKLSRNGKEFLVSVKKELILSCGSINSPQLLLLSGIGPETKLKEMDINVIADLPVGESLQDHVFVPIIYTAPAPLETRIDLEGITQALAAQILEGTGSLSDVTPHRVIAFVNITDSMSVLPSSQYHFIVFPPRITDMLDMFDKHELTDEVITKFKALNDNHFALIIFNTLLRPKSKGKIVLKSKNPFEYPLIYANYFDDDEDINTIIKAFKHHVLRFGDTNSFKDFGFKLDWIDIEACNQFDKNSDEFLECYTREMTFSLYHPTSTCKMGPTCDETAVVDHELRVKGIKGLRVVDASIMPSIVRGNTNGPTIMIGEKGADMIKAFWLDKIHAEL